MVTNKVLGAFLVILIVFLGLVLAFIADGMKVINISETFPFLKSEPKLLGKKYDPPDALAIEEFRKNQEKLLEDQEKLVQQELTLEAREEELNQLQDELEQMKNNLDLEKEKLVKLLMDKEDRDSKIKDLAGKISNMPPKDAVTILLSWNDYDVIDVFKQMDKNSAEAGIVSIVPFLLNLMEEREPGRAGNITKKWLQDPKLQANGSG